MMVGAGGRGATTPAPPMRGSDMEPAGSASAIGAGDGTNDAQEGSATHRGTGSGLFVSFLPWIAVWVLTSNHSFQPGLVVATLCSFGLVGWTLIEHRRPQLLDGATLVVLVLLTALAFAVDPSWLASWLPVLLNGALLLIMVGSLLVGHPFTLGYAEQQAPPEVWDTPGFRHVNRMITLVWVLAVLAMTAGALVTALVQEGAIQTTASQTRSVETWATWGTTVVGLVVALKFTAWYPDAYRDRHQPPAGAG